MKIYRRFLASYLCVCLIPLLLSLVAVVRLERNVSRDVSQYQEDSIREAQGNMDQSLSYAVSAVELMSKETLVEQLSQKQSLEGMEIYDLCKLSKIFSAIINRQTAYAYGFCYFPRSDFLASNRSTYHPGLAYLFTWELGIDTDYFFSSLETGRASTSIRTLVKENGDGYILVLRNVYNNSGTEILSRIGIVVRPDKELSQWATDSTEAFVADEAGQLLYGGEHAQAVFEKAQADGSETGQIKLDGEYYRYSLYSSNLSQLQYGFLMLWDVYYRDLRLILQEIVIELAVVFVFGILLALFWSRRTWRPIQSILPFVERSVSPEGEGNVSSMADLTRAITSFAQETEQLKTHVVQTEERVRTIYAARYLTGRSQDPSVLSQYLEEGQPYQLIAFVPVCREAEKPGQRSVEETLISLYGGVEDALLDNNAGACLFIDGCVVLLIQGEAGREELERAVSQIERKLSLSLVCYVSNLCSHLSDAPEAWQWVQCAYRNDAFWQYQREPGIWTANELLKNQSYQSFKDFLAHQRALSGCLENSNLKKARKYLDKILEQDVLDRRQPVELIRHRCVSIAEVLLPYAPETRYDEVERGILRCATADAAAGELTALFERIQSQCAPEDSGDDLVERVQRYVRENYQDAALSAGMIANYLNMNLSTLSRQYKDAAGHGLLDEIHSVRLLEAKRLLQSGASVRETAEQTGYADSRALIRAFKRYENVTPGQYAGKE